MPYRRHLASSKDLVTTYEETRSGFITVALEKARRSTPYVEEARALRVSAAGAKSPKELLDMHELQGAVLAAAGISDKAAKRMKDDDRKEAVAGFVSNYLEPAGHDFVDELVFRFLLTRGDTIGGTMRNVAGEWGKQRVVKSLIAALVLQERPFQWLHSSTGAWVKGSKDEPIVEGTVEALAWNTKGRPRLLVFNKKPAFIDKNVDVCILECQATQFAARRNDPLAYRALGEIKGGVDPAGADEHWKTARTTLQRVRTAFSRHELSPPTFFVGAAIVPRMADEIWEQLNGQVLTNAANLTVANQVASLSKWISEV